VLETVAVSQVETNDMEGQKSDGMCYTTSYHLVGDIVASDQEAGEVESAVDGLDMILYEPPVSAPIGMFPSFPLHLY
jgi:hypothetical protein